MTKIMLKGFKHVSPYDVTELRIDNLTEDRLIPQLYIEIEEF